MRKRIVPLTPLGYVGADEEANWLEIEQLAIVEITSEDSLHPIESALVPGQGDEWRAAQPGTHRLRILFNQAQVVRRIRVHFSEPIANRTQEFVLRWSAGFDQPFHEVVRQQWNFSQPNAVEEIEDYRVDLKTVAILELTITPDINDGETIASLRRLQIA